MLRLTEEPSHEKVNSEPKYMEHIRTLKQKSKELVDLIDKTESIAVTGNRERLYDNIVMLAKKTVNLSDWTKRLISMTGNDIQTVMYKADAVAKCVIEENGEIYRIIFDRLLPHKLKRDTKTTDTSGVYDGYLVDLYRELGRINPQRYKEPVVMIFLNHFSSEETICDDDNLETAAFVDAISSKMLIDDNPKWCKKYFDYTMDDTDYSEIIVVPEKKFLSVYMQIKNATSIS